jgi:hypothetical protein
VTYAKGTSVSPEKSRAEIEQTLKRYGADAFSYGYEGDRAIVAFRCEGRYVRFDLRMPPLKDFKTYKHGNEWGLRSRTDAQAAQKQEQAIKEKWRALLLVVKAKLESVESGIESFDEAFMPHLLLPDQSKVADWMGPQIAAAYETGEMPSLLPVARPQLEAGEDDESVDAEVVS